MCMPGALAPDWHRAANLKVDHNLDLGVPGTVPGDTVTTRHRKLVASFYHVSPGFHDLKPDAGWPAKLQHTQAKHLRMQRPPYLTTFKEDPERPIVDLDSFNLGLNRAESTGKSSSKSSGKSSGSTRRGSLPSTTSGSSTSRRWFGSSTRGRRGRMQGLCQSIPVNKAYTLDILCVLCICLYTCLCITVYCTEVFEVLVCIMCISVHGSWNIISLLSLKVHIYLCVYCTSKIMVYSVCIMLQYLYCNIVYIAVYCKCLVMYWYLVKTCLWSH